MNYDYLLNLSTEFYSSEDIEECINKKQIQTLTDSQIDELIKTQVYGTPTIFVNGEAVVGPKQFRVYERLLE